MGKKEKAKKAHSPADEVSWIANYKAHLQGLMFMPACKMNRYILSQGTSSPTALRQEQSQCLGQFMKSLPNDARQELMSFKVSDLLILAKRADKEKLSGEKLDKLNESGMALNVSLA